MKRALAPLIALLTWSWVVTLPIVLIGAILVSTSLTRFYTFGVRYDPRPAKFLASDVARYEIDALTHSVHLAATRIAPGKPAFRRIDLLLPEANRAQLEDRMPQSGFEYVPGGLRVEGDWVKAKIKYRGDFFYHWAWNKKSIRVKTGKNHLFEGLRSFNLQAPKFEHQLNNYLSLQLADRLGLIAPKTELVSLYINNANQGVHVFVEQLSEETLRRAGVMPADLYRGEIVGKDAFLDSGVHSLFETSAVWDKMATNNHYDAESMAPLEQFLDLIRNAADPEAQESLSDFLDIDAWARFSVFEALAQTRHYLQDHNWRLYYDPWRRKLSPIVWDPVGWSQGWWPKPDEKAAPEVITTSIHKALFRNGDFLRARARILREFFDANWDGDFVAFVDETIEAMDHEIPRDPNLQPPDPVRVSQSMQSLRDMIARVFAEIDTQARTSNQDLLFAIAEGGLEISINGPLPVRRLRLVFESPPRNASQLILTYRTRSREATVDLPFSVDVSTNEVRVEAGLLSSFEIGDSTNSSFPTKRTFLPAFYQLRSEDIDPDALRAVFADRGEGWEELRRVEDLRQTLELANGNAGTSDASGQNGWQLFWDTGSGFHRGESTPPSRVKVDSANRWSLARNLPNDLQRLRVDLPADQDMELSDLAVLVDGKQFEIPVSSLTLNSIEMAGSESIRAKPSRDPYFVFEFPVRPEVGREEPFATQLRFTVRPLAGSAWERAQAAGRVGEVSVEHAPAPNFPSTNPIVWAETVTLAGRHVIEQPLVIQPGTQILFRKGATLILENRLIAVGTSEAPIRFRPEQPGQDAWGSVVLMGPGASGSRLAHCEFTEGSGVKTDLFESTAMFSIHDVKNVVVSDCRFIDSRHTDDMVHAVYADVRFERCEFLNAPFDALDIDLSNVEIEDSLFVNSGNDALDLMTSTARVIGTTFRNSGDKAISVGEGSQLIAIDDHMIGNQIGVQAKDRSVAALIHLDMQDNVQALDAFKKNWRYGSGGTIVLAKSSLASNGTAATADKHSEITVFDSSVDRPTPSKHVHFDRVDAGASAREEELLSESALRVLSEMHLPGNYFRDHVRETERGALSPPR